MPRPKPIEPTKPQPEAFGLTAQRIQEYEGGSKNRAGNPLIGCYGCGFLALVVSLFVVPLAIHNYLFVLPFLVVVVVWGVIDTIISRRRVSRLERQPDIEEFRRYQQACTLYDQAINKYRQDVELWHRTQVEWWCRLSGQRFERELGQLLKKLGYRVQLTGAAGDGGVDLILQTEAVTILVQCKAQANPVGPGPVRDLFGTLTHRSERIAWLVSTAGFTSGARAFASGKAIRLLTISEILQRADAFGPSGSPPGAVARGTHITQRRCTECGLSIPSSAVMCACGYSLGGNQR